MATSTTICTDTVYLTPELESDLDARLSRIEGQVKGIRRMLAEHADCESLIIQTAAAKAALNQVLIKLLEGHMETCVAESIRAGNGPEALARLKGAMATALKNS
jgi:DNA-binding FrmR family transcriptional regulator